MENLETKIDQEAIESAVKQIHYYSNLPKHIKGRVTQLNNIKSNEGMPKPAHLIEGVLTVIMGKMNIPSINYRKQFINHNVIF